MNCWIEGEATSFDWIVQDTGSTPATYKQLFIPNPFSSDEENEEKNLHSNRKRMQKVHADRETMKSCRDSV